jgi:protein involved in polysaccharide export with SLBB domain
MLKTLLSAILLIALFLFIPRLVLNAQNSFADLSSINIDKLSDAQVLNYIEQARARGLSQSDLENLARQRGISPSELEKLKSRIQALGSNAANGDKVNVERPSLAINNQDIFGLLVGETSPQLTELESKIFGLGLFRKNNLSFTPNLNLPTPLDYVLGPGDEVIVDLWGASQEFFRLAVNNEGTIRPEIIGIGPIYVNGLTIEKATERIIDRFSQVFSGLKEKDGNGPSVFYQVSLGQIRTITVEVVGSVEQSGLYALPSLATVYSALHAAGGPSVQGTFRNVRLVRNNKLLTEVDIYTFLTSGIRSGDIRLQNGDVIIVPSFSTRVNLSGLVKKPGLYELKEAETISDLLDFAEGFDDSAFESVLTVKRNGKNEREIYDVKESELDTFKPQNGDSIEVGAIFNRFANRVAVNGAVFRQGEYELTDGMTVMELIENAGGLRGDAFLGRANVFRLEDNFAQTIIPIELAKILDGTSPNIALKKEDVLNINSIYDISEEFFVQIGGEVLQNAVFPYFDQMNLLDLIVLAGGLKEAANGAYIEISRRNRGTDKSNLAEIVSMTIEEDGTLSSENRNFLLQPFDQVYIRRSSNYSVQNQLTIEGEIKAPGSYTISKKDERVSDIIQRAKGLTKYAYPKGAILIRRAEFVKEQSTNSISPSDLRELRQKILRGQSQVKNTVQHQLIDRIDQLKTETEIANRVDVEGGRFKGDLIREQANRDTLVRNLNLNSQEPVTLYLEEILANPGSRFDVVVKGGDIISIPSVIETVRVAGEVSTPLNILYYEKNNFKDYIQLSGGFLQSAKRGNSFVQYPNGERRGVRRFLWFKTYPKIEPGSTIVVARKPERTPISLQSILAATSTLATIALLVNNITK